jgi:hypothetical protein
LISFGRKEKKKTMVPHISGSMALMAQDYNMQPVLGE